MVNLDNDWEIILEKEFKKKYFLDLQRVLQEEYQNCTVYPPKRDILNALRYTSYNETKVVILGQDPYHGKGQAHGLSFSVRPGVKKPPSLQNIFKELESDIGMVPPTHGHLKKWAEEGVLLLNTVLTVREGEPQSHKNIGWEKFTDHIISCLNERARPVVFILWGKNAQQKKSLITHSRHFILSSSHPSPLSARRSFFGSRVFSKCNEILLKEERSPVDWTIPEKITIE